MKILITGATGQDGAIKTYQRWKKGDEIHIFVRRKIDNSLGKLDEIIKRVPELGKSINIHYVDMIEYEKIMDKIQEIKPDRIYHFASQSFVTFSFDNPVYTMIVNTGSTYAILEAVKKYSPSTEVYIASSSEIYGGNEEYPYKLNSSYYPVSPYALTKLDVLFIARMYRKMGIRAYVGILFNHESELRSDEFVTMKIVKSLISKGFVTLGNVNSMKDWGYTPEYMQVIDKNIENDNTEFMICTGKLASVKDFAYYVMDLLNLDNKEDRIIIDKSLFRPIDTKPMTCDTKYIKYIPTIDWKKVAEIMVNYIKNEKMELLNWT